MRNIIKLASVLAIVLAAYYLFFRSPEEKSGKPAPDFEAELISGESFELSQLKGSYVLLDFWGSWCGPCRKENPELVSLYNTMKDRRFKDADGFELVSVALEKNGDAWKRVAERDGFDWPLQIVQMSKVVVMSPIAQKYAVSNIPAKFLIDPDGMIIGVNQPIQEIHDFLASKSSNL